jgi:hypothetical protein
MVYVDNTGDTTVDGAVAVRAATPLPDVVRRAVEALRP